MEEAYFLEKIKKVDPDFKKLYDEITGHKINEKNNQDKLSLHSEIKKLFSFGCRYNYLYKSQKST